MSPEQAFEVMSEWLAELPFSEEEHRDLLNRVQLYVAERTHRAAPGAELRVRLELRDSLQQMVACDESAVWVKALDSKTIRFIVSELGQRLALGLVRVMATREGRTFDAGSTPAETSTAYRREATQQQIRSGRWEDEVKN